MSDKRASGGKRAGDKRRAEKAARELRARLAAEGEGVDHDAEWNAFLDFVGEPPEHPEDAHAWLGKAATGIVWETLRDRAMAPEARRRDAMRQIEQASKVLDPAKLSAEIDELERALEEVRSNAGPVEKRATRSPSTGTDQPE